MPRFHWKGRSADGRTVEGESDAASKDDVVTRLRAQRIMVTTVTAAGGGEPVDPAAPAPAPPPEGLVDRMARARASQPPRRLRGLLIAAAFVGAALAVGLMAPITTYRCERVDGETVNCSLTERDLGVLTTREQRLTGVNYVGYETRWIPGRDEHGVDTRRASMRLLLRNGSGASVSPTHWDWDGGGRNGIGDSTSSIESAIANLVRGGITGPVSMWQGQWLPLLLSALLLILGVLMLGVTILSLFAGPADAVYAAVGGLAAAGDARRGRRGH
jgi:hypothetical protein